MNTKNNQYIFSLEKNDTAEVKRLEKLIVEGINVDVQGVGDKRDVSIVENVKIEDNTNINADLLRIETKTILAKRLDWSLLMHEVFAGYSKAVRVLLDAGANVNLVVEPLDKWTALIVAACRGHAVITKMLLESDAKVNATTGKGETALMFAALFGHTEVIEELLKQKDIDVHAKNKSNKTALDLAATPEITAMLKPFFS